MRQPVVVGKPIQGGAGPSRRPGRPHRATESDISSPHTHEIALRSRCACSFRLSEDQDGEAEIEMDYTRCGSALSLGKEEGRI